MKKLFLITLIVGLVPLSMSAQDDDMYFVPKKADKEARQAARVTPHPAPAGLDMSVDSFALLKCLYYQPILALAVFTAMIFYGRR